MPWDTIPQQPANLLLLKEALPRDGCLGECPWDPSRRRAKPSRQPFGSSCSSNTSRTIRERRSEERERERERESAPGVAAGVPPVGPLRWVEEEEEALGPMQKIKKEHIFLRTSPPSLGRDTLGLGTPGTLWVGHEEHSGLGEELQGHSGVGHSRDERGVDQT